MVPLSHVETMHAQVVCEDEETLPVGLDQNELGDVEFDGIIGQTEQLADVIIEALAHPRHGVRFLVH